VSAFVPIRSPWKPTGRQRFRRGFMKAVVLQIEEISYRGRTVGSEAHFVGERRRWRDARWSDVHADPFHSKPFDGAAL
jgi:hypothetical protein